MCGCDDGRGSIALAELGLVALQRLRPCTHVQHPHILRTFFRWQAALGCGIRSRRCRSSSIVGLLRREAARSDQDQDSHRFAPGRSRPAALVSPSPSPHFVNRFVAQAVADRPAGVPAAMQEQDLGSCFATSRALMPNCGVPVTPWREMISSNHAPRFVGSQVVEHRHRSPHSRRPAARAASCRATLGSELNMSTSK